MLSLAVVTTDIPNSRREILVTGARTLADGILYFPFYSILLRGNDQDLSLESYQFNLIKSSRKLREENE